MNLSFSSKLISGVFIFILISVAAPTGVTLYLYQKDKMASIYRNEIEDTGKVAASLDGLLLLSRVISHSKVKGSKQIIALFENVCQHPTYEISESYREQLSELEVNMMDWVSSLEVFELCRQSKVFKLTDAGKMIKILQPGVRLMVPYMSVFLKEGDSERVAVLAMDRFASNASNTLFLSDSTGKQLWSSDEPDFVDGALADTEVVRESLDDIMGKAAATQKSDVFPLGRYGLLSYAPVNSIWSMVSLADAPTVMLPLYFAIRQSILMGLALLFFILFLAKHSAKWIVRPLGELRTFAEKLGAGDFNQRIQVTGTDEFSTVKRAFNRMTEEIVKLIEETKEKANLESELNVAKKVQQMLIPPSLVKIKNNVMNSLMITASQCGGDWWGYVDIPDRDGQHRFLVMIGDVTGHGVPSALITASVKGAISVISRLVEKDPLLAEDPGTINRYLNQTIYETSATQLSMTFFVALIDLDKKIMKCSNAGHNFPYLVTNPPGSAQPVIKPLGQAGIPLGNDVNSLYDEVKEYPWVEGSKLFLYTDGLIDCTRGEEVLYDRKTLNRSLKAHGKLSGSQLLKKVMMDHDEKAAGLIQPDDITVVVCEYLEGGGP